MSKKKTDPVAPPVVPEPEEEVQLPPEIPLPNPPTFAIVLGHLFSELVEGDREDPTALLFARAKEPGDTLSKKVVVIDRDDMQTMAGEDHILVGLRLRLQKERASRARRKSNLQRRRLMSEADGAQEAEDGVDCLVLLRGYPANLEELQDLSDARLSEGVVDLWAVVCIAADREPVPEVAMFCDGIRAAPLDADLANCRVHTIAESVLEVPLTANHIQDVVVNTLGADMELKSRFDTWMQSPTVVVPELSQTDGECRLYNRLMDTAPHTDVAWFLHSLSEQVALNLEDAKKYEDELALKELITNFKASFDVMSDEAQPLSNSGASFSEPVHLPSPAPLVPYLNRIACLYGVGSARTESVDRVFRNVVAPGTQRRGLPKDAVHSIAEREAVQSRFYSFAPSFSAVGLEQMIVLHAFEELMGLAQPERTWNFSDRTLRERIPAALVGENLHAAFQLEPFVNSTYVPRYDCLLLALHLRSPPGRHVWHTWCGDLLSNPEAFGDTLLPKPTFNDWSRIFGTSDVPSSTLVQLDARTFGYAKAREKLVTPSDGSAILVTTLSRGLENSFPRAEGETFEPEPLCSSRFARVMKNGLTFGINPDSASENGATKSALFWLVFVDNSRCTVRVDKDVGAILTYVQATGQIVQVRSGTMVIISDVAEATEDTEIERIVTPSGTIVRKFLSGRVEVYHADGTTAKKNPADPHAKSVQPGRTPFPGSWEVVRPSGETFVRCSAQSPLFTGGLVDEGQTVELRVEGHAASMQTDLFTKQRTLINSSGLSSFEDPDGAQLVTLHRDGTRVTTTKDAQGHTLSISKEGLPHFTCHVGTTSRMIADCMDGTQLEIAQRGTDEVVLRHWQGSMLHSDGFGQVGVFGSHDAPVKNLGESDEYVAHCSEGILRLATNTSSVELHADQTVSAKWPQTKSVRMEEPGSPRCSVAGMGFTLGSATELHSDTPPPRLFMVHGDGDAEEFLTPAARQVLGGTEISEQRDTLTCHTSFSDSFPLGVVPARVALAIPVLAGLAPPTCGASPLLPSLPQPPTAKATMYRQLIEHPYLHEPKFRGTLKQYQKWELQKLILRRKVGLPPENKKSLKRDVKGKSPRRRRGKPLEEVAEPEPEPSFIPDLNLSAFELSVASFCCRASLVSPPTQEDLLSSALATKSCAEVSSVGQEETEVHEVVSPQITPQRACQQVVDTKQGMPVLESSSFTFFDSLLRASPTLKDTPTHAEQPQSESLQVASDVQGAIFETPHEEEPMLHLHDEQDEQDAHVDPACRFSGDPVHQPVSGPAPVPSNFIRRLEVVPEACRFGLVRQGGVYQMTVRLRNLDVETRFRVVVDRTNGHFDDLKVTYTSGLLAPGMTTKCVVQLAAREPLRVEQCVEVRTQTNVARIPVTARIVDVEEFDRLDRESIALHGRRIGAGKHNLMIMDEACCRKVLGSAFVPPAS